ncbi:MAG: hypothetical protein H0W61_04140 [Bacteroidetes bacterium]|nr:hypothetical protein [Bacteroidota bacterium]
MRTTCFIFTLAFLTASLFSQVPATIKVKKEKHTILFFQKGIKTDTLTRASLFYLVVDEASKNDLSVFVDNGQLVKTENDSLYMFRYIKGMNYECVFNSTGNTQKNSKSAFEFKALVNGVSAEPSNKIVIKLKMKNKDSSLIENTFYYKE